MYDPAVRAGGLLVNAYPSILEKSTGKDILT